MACESDARCMLPSLSRLVRSVLSSLELIEDEFHQVTTLKLGTFRGHLSQQLVAFRIDRSNVSQIHHNRSHQVAPAKITPATLELVHPGATKLSLHLEHGRLRLFNKRNSQHAFHPS